MSDIDATRPPRRGPGPFGRAVLVLLWLTAGLAPIALSVPDLELALGRTGTPGTLTVLSCQPLGQGRYDCRGRFTPDGGGPPVLVAASPDSRAGDVTRARLAPGGDRALPDGVRGVLAASAVPAMGVGGLGFLPYVVAYWWGARRARRPTLVAGVVVSAAGGALMLAGLMAAYA